MMASSRDWSWSSLTWRTPNTALSREETLWQSLIPLGSNLRCTSPRMMMCMLGASRTYCFPVLLELLQPLELSMRSFLRYSAHSTNVICHTFPPKLIAPLTNLGCSGKIITASPGFQHTWIGMCVVITIVCTYVECSSTVCFVEGCEQGFNLLSMSPLAACRPELLMAPAVTRTLAVYCLVPALPSHLWRMKITNLLKQLWATLKDGMLPSTWQTSVACTILSMTLASIC